MRLPKSLTPVRKVLAPFSAVILKPSSGFFGGSRSNRRPTRVGKTLAGFFSELGLCAVNMLPMTQGPVNTFCSGVGSSMIDYIAVPDSIKSSVLSCSVLHYEILNTSDHFAVCASLDFECGETAPPPVNSFTSVKWDKLRKDVIREKYTERLEVFARSLLHDCDFRELDKYKIDETIECVVAYMMKLSGDLPKTKFRPNVRPYWNDKLRYLKTKKVDSYRKWVNKGRPRSNECAEWLEYKSDKKAFRREIKYVHKQYEKNEIDILLKTAEWDKNHFWQLLKKSRKNSSSNSDAIKNKHGKVVHNLEELVGVWKSHFEALSTDKHLPRFDAQHYDMVTKKVKCWFGENDMDNFLETRLTSEKVLKALKKLNGGKAAGFDGVTAEYLQYTGEAFLGLLVELFNCIIQREYVPCNFRVGTQIPLYKGKNTCSLDPNNYRGITLLTSLNKLFEILMWNRLKE